MNTNDKCIVCQSSYALVKINNLKYCNKHYRQMKKYGEIRERTIRDKNGYEVLDDIAFIYLYDVNSQLTGKTIIDTEDLERCIKHKWSNDGSGYVRATIENKHTPLHRFIMNARENEIVDHQDQNRLNNCKNNLRFCTTSQNGMNQSKRNNNTSGVIGVKEEKNNKWRARITINKKLTHLGTFDNFEDAVNARKSAEIKYFGEFASNV